MRTWDGDDQYLAGCASAQRSCDAKEQAVDKNEYFMECPVGLVLLIGS
jgi:hypothetical protein